MKKVIGSYATNETIKKQQKGIALKTAIKRL